MAFVENVAPPIEPAQISPAQKVQGRFGQVPPVLAASNIPSVGTTTGNVAAGVENLDLSNGQKGRIRVVPLTGVASSGSLALVFPSTPPTLFIAGDDALGTLTQATVSNTVTISWTGASMIAGKQPGYRIIFQWANSQ